MKSTINIYTYYPQVISSYAQKLSKTDYSFSKIQTPDLWTPVLTAVVFLQTNLALPYMFSNEFHPTMMLFIQLRCFYLPWFTCSGLCLTSRIIPMKISKDLSNEPAHEVSKVVKYVIIS